MNKIRLIEAGKQAKDRSRVRELLSYAVYNPTEARLHDLLSTTYARADTKLLLLQVADEIYGILGVQQKDVATIEILHIAVDKPYRGQHVGQLMIQKLIESLEVSKLVAETDRHAVEFYAKCGFFVQSLGEKYPGTERFCCTLEIRRE